MIYTISTNQAKDIIVGSKIQILADRIPLQFKNQWLDVLRVDESGPYVSLEEHMVNPDDVESEINAASCISPQIIQAVI